MESTDTVFAKELQELWFTPTGIKKLRSHYDLTKTFANIKKVEKNIYKADCPFCKTKNNLRINKRKQIFYCFGCQKGGDIITYFREKNNCSFNEAVNELNLKLWDDVEKVFKNPVAFDRTWKKVWRKIQKKENNETGHQRQDRVSE